MTDRYTLFFEIDAENLDAMRARAARIVVAKQGFSRPANVAWLAWAPSRGDIVAWRETYGLYAADAVLQSGSLVEPAAIVDPALDRATYPFRGDSFGPFRPAPRLPARHYDARNESGGAVAFGLLQWAAVNGSAFRSPVNVVVVPPGFTADFAPLENLSIWVASGVRGGSIVRVPRTATTLDFATRRTAHVRYDAAGARFVATESTEARRRSERRARPPLVPLRLNTVTARSIVTFVERG